MITHPELVKALIKPGQQICYEMTASDANILHMAIGICGEAGEMMDAIKKKVIYRKELDRTNVIEELGDLEFYMEGLRQALDIRREDTLGANIAKLSARYEKLSYSDKAAAERADKQEEAVYKEGMVRIVHHLQAGKPACGIAGVPRDWPKGHLWSAYWGETDCPDCLKLKPADDNRVMPGRIEHNLVPQNKAAAERADLAAYGTDKTVIQKVASSPSRSQVLWDAEPRHPTDGSR